MLYVVISVGIEIWTCGTPPFWVNSLFSLGIKLVDDSDLWSINASFRVCKWNIWYSIVLFSRF